ncbi:MAG: TonB-dependent receptor [Acidobacteria bacterium]|nr:TonB-dependent receptor [Acidobacteriota bacterium]
MIRSFSSLIIVVALCVLPTAVFASPGNPQVVKGHVLDPAGLPVTHVTVLIRSAAGHVRQAETDAEGVFAFTDVAPGVYDVLAPVDGFRTNPVKVAVGEHTPPDIQITLLLSGLTETVVISAGYVDTSLSEAPGSVTTLTSHDLASRQITTVAQALQMVPGFSVAPTGGAGSLTSLFPRGGDSDYTLVLLDGVRLNSMGGGFDFGHLTTTGLEQLEVVRGPQSAVFGADAIGGVIQLRSKIGGRPAVSGGLETGGYGTNRLTLGSTGSRGLFSWGAHVERSSSDGWTGVAPGTTDRVTNDNDAATAVAVATGWKLSDRSTLRVDGRFSTDDRGYPGPFGSNPIGAFAGIDRISRGRNHDGLGSIAFTHAWGPQSTLRVQATYADMRSAFTSTWGDSSARTRRLTTHAQLDHAFSSHAATSVGVDLTGERGDSTYIVGTAGQMVPVRRQVAGYFAEARFRASERLFVTTGLRVEHIVRSALEPDPLAYAPRPALPEDRVFSVNPRVAVSYYLRTSGDSRGNWTRVHATAGTGIRPPDALEIAFTDNPGLRPERNRSADAGLEQSLLGGLLVVDATAFVNRYEDLIVAVGRSLQDYSRFQTDNISNARARGIETSAALRTRGGLEIRTSYTWLDTTILAVDRSPLVAPPPFSVGDPLLRRPRHQASLDIVWARGPVTAYARVGGRSRMLDVEPSWGAISGGLFHAPGFAVANAGVSLAVRRGINIIARFDNLLDRQYEAVLGYPAPRRSFTVGVRLAPGR